MGESPAILDYVRRYTTGLPPNSRLKLDVTPVGVTITLPARNIGIVLLALSPIILFLGVLLVTIIANAGEDPGLPYFGILPVLGIGLLVLIIRRRSIPSALAIVEKKLIVLTPDRFRLRREFLLDAGFSVRAKATGIGIDRRPPAMLEVQRSGKCVGEVFRNLSGAEIDWVVSVMNSAIVHSLSV